MKEKLTSLIKFCVRIKKQRKLRILRKELASIRNGVMQMEMLASETGVEMTDYASSVREQATEIEPKVIAKIKELEADLA